MNRSPLDLDLDTMKRLGHQVADVVAEHLAGIRDEPVIATVPRAQLNSDLLLPAPEGPTDFAEILRTLEEKVFPYHAREPHPGFLAYVSSCPTFPSLLGDWLATGYNFFAGVWPVAAGPNEIEMAVLEWIRAWTGMPEGSSGLLTSGGSAANTTAVVAARHRAVERGGDIRRLIMYTSAQAHSSVVRAAWVAGIARSNVRLIETDELFRMRLDRLEEAIARDKANGDEPFLIAANGGATNTGAVDPIEELASISKASSMWLHVDAAYAGFAVLTEEGRKLLGRIDVADSITLDPHKWLFVPFECGCLMVRDPATLSDAFRITPEYLKDVEPGEEEVNFADRGVQLTRYSRALKIWVSVKYFGTEVIASAIQDAMERARLLDSLVRADESFEILSPAQFGIVCFRAKPRGLDESELDSLNERINSRVVSEGRFLISSTRLNGKFSLRMCTLGYRTTQDDVRNLFDTIRRSLDVEIESR
ncbi:MAG TPA: aminotransferase class V-fold PLP-dependent enzyme [Gemmatimonadaceae bacterium]